MRKYRMSVFLPGDADEERIPTRLWDLIAIALQARDFCANEDLKARTHWPASGRRSTVPVHDPEFWSKDDTTVELSRILRYFFQRNIEIEFVPLSEGRSFIHRFERASDRNGHSSAPERSLHIQAFSPDVDSLATVLRGSLRENSEQILVSLRVDQRKNEPWWDIVDPTGSLRNTMRVRSVAATLESAEDGDRALETPCPLVHLLTAIAVALALDSPVVCLAKNGIEHLQLPLSMAVNTNKVSPTITPLVTSAIEQLVSRMSQRPVAITNPLIWHTPSQITRTLLSETEISNSNSERALWDVLVGRALDNPALRMDSSLATLHAASTSDQFGERERQEVLRSFISTDTQVSMRAYIQKLRELPTLPKSELGEQLQRLPGGTWYGKQNWSEHIRDILLRHADEMRESLTEILRHMAGQLIAGTVPFHSALGQALLPTDLTQFYEPTFQRRGEMWAVWYREGDTQYIGDSLGLQYIHYLLRYPHNEFSAIQLRADINGTEVIFSQGMEAMDRETIKSLRQYREILIENLRASNDNDVAKRAQWDRELKIVDGELKRGVGLGGSPRIMGELEKARRSISAAIHRALHSIEEAHAKLHEHLRESLHIGTFLSYSPREEVAWNTG